MNCVPFQAHQMRMAQNAAQNANRMPGVPRHNGPQYSMMQPHLQRQVNKGIIDPSFLLYCSIFFTCVGLLVRDH